MAQTVEQLRRWGVGLGSYSEPWLDTSGTSPVGDLRLNILASFAQFERALIAGANRPETHQHINFTHTKPWLAYRIRSRSVDHVPEDDSRGANVRQAAG